MKDKRAFATFFLTELYARSISCRSVSAALLANIFINCAAKSPLLNSKSEKSDLGIRQLEQRREKDLQNSDRLVWLQDKRIFLS